jgi:hypothetical protein
VPPTPAEPDDLFREINDRIIELGERFGLREERLELICECEDPSCTERVGIAHAEFAELRTAHGSRLVADGHEHSARIVGHGDGYVVVGD